MDKKKIIAKVSSLSAEQLFDAIKQGVITLEELRATGNLDFNKRKIIADLLTQLDSQDDAAWEDARFNSDAGIRDYMALHPSGKFLQEAKDRINELEIKRQEINMSQDKNDKPCIIISYSWNDKEHLATFFESLKENLDEIGVEMVSDKIEFNYKGSINDFMQKDGEGKFIILLITDNYLKSQSCMFEFNEILRSKTFNNRFFPIITDNANIFSIQNRIKYVNFWDTKINEIQGQIEELENIPNSKEKDERKHNIVFYNLNIYSNIRNNLVHNLDRLMDMKVIETDDDVEGTSRFLCKSIETIIKFDKIKSETNE